MARLIVGWDTPNVSASSACARLRRRYVNVTTTALNNPRIGGQTFSRASAVSRRTRPHRSRISAVVSPVV